jgi:cobalt-zinc-cadmium efflux system outer membrane protein
VNGLRPAAALLCVLVPTAGAWPAQPPTAGATAVGGHPRLSESVEALPPDDTESTGGLTLDDAIGLLLERSIALRVKYQEIPMARADELTARLRNAPVLFADGGQLPYGRFSPQRPGVPNAELSPTQNVDYGGKRGAHMRQAEAARHEIEARYQDAVRLEIDELQDDFVDILEMAGRVRAAGQRADGLARFRTTVEGMVQRGTRTRADAADVALQHFNARTELDESEARLLGARRDLATRLNIPPDQAAHLRVRNTLGTPPEPPDAAAVLRLALNARPDLAADRLAVANEQAVVGVTRHERFDDAIVFVAPYEAQDYRPQGKHAATDWGAGILAAVPIRDRNQGRIARAHVNVRQRRIAVDAAQRRIAAEVQRGLAEFRAAGEAVRRFEREGLPASRLVAAERLRSYLAGDAAIGAYLAAEEHEHEEHQRYEEARARLLRYWLKLGIVAGTRLAR